MGADLLLTALVHKKDKKLNWPAGRQVARKLDKEKLLAGMEECFGDSSMGVVEARKTLQAMISSLKKEISDPHGARDAYVWTVGTKVLHIRGGTSWGDDPSDGWTTFTDVQHFPEVLRAIGFDLGAIK